MSREERLKKLVEHGLTRAQAEEYLTENDRLDAQLDALKCPQCGGQLSRRLDGRQAGVRQAGTVWFNYRCTCGYMCDRAEPEN